MGRQEVGDQRAPSGANLRQMGLSVVSEVVRTSWMRRMRYRFEEAFWVMERCGEQVGRGVIVNQAYGP